MERVYDISDKIMGYKGAALVINGNELHVNADFGSVMQLLSLTKSGALDSGDIDALIEAYNILFSEEDRSVLTKMKLSVEDFKTIVNCGIRAAGGFDPTKTEEEDSPQ